MLLDPGLPARCLIPMMNGSAWRGTRRELVLKINRQLLAWFVSGVCLMGCFGTVTMPDGRKVSIERVSLKSQIGPSETRKPTQGTVLGSFTFSDLEGGYVTIRGPYRPDGTAKGATVWVYRFDPGKLGDTPLVANFEEGAYLVAEVNRPGLIARTIPVDFTFEVKPNETIYVGRLHFEIQRTAAHSVFTPSSSRPSYSDADVREVLLDEKAMFLAAFTQPYRLPNADTVETVVMWQNPLWRRP